MGRIKVAVVSQPSRQGLVTVALPSVAERLPAALRLVCVLAALALIGSAIGTRLGGIKSSYAADFFVAAKVAVAVWLVRASGRRSGVWLTLAVFGSFLCWQAWTLGTGRADCGCLGSRTTLHAVWVAAYDLLIVLACWAALAPAASRRAQLARPLALACLPATLFLVGAVVLGLLRPRPDFRQVVADARTVAASPLATRPSTQKADGGTGRAPTSPLTLVSPILDFGLMKVGGERAMTLEVIISSDRLATIRDIQVECEACTRVQLTDRFVPPRSRLKVPVTFRALDRDVGITRHGVVVTTDDPGAPSLNAAVVATVARTAAAVPSNIALADVPADGRPLEVAVHNLSDQPVRILYARWTTKGLSIRCPAAPIEPGGVGVVEVAHDRATGGQAASTPASGEVTLTLDHPDLRSIAIRIDGP